jgi:hypothetical protein
MGLSDDISHQEKKNWSAWSNLSQNLKYAKIVKDVMNFRLLEWGSIRKACIRIINLHEKWLKKWRYNIQKSIEWKTYNKI